MRNIPGFLVFGGVDPVLRSAPTGARVGESVIGAETGAKNRGDPRELAYFLTLFCDTVHNLQVNQGWLS
jgi:hypothetical protein